MQTIGLIGGMSWESTVSYYQMINRGIKAQLGGLHSAKLILYSVDFAEIESLQHKGDWDQAANILVAAAQSLQKAGADFILICTNTMHKVAEEVAQKVDIPLLHIADATGMQLKRDGITKVGLLGTKFTMTEGFYKDRLTDKFAIEVLVPTPLEQDIIHQVIYDELCLGKVIDNSRHQIVHVIRGLHKRGAQAVILGCTEIALLVQQQHTQVPLYDTTALHANVAVDLALS
jgi:aspartate racemase